MATPTTLTHTYDAGQHSNPSVTPKELFRITTDWANTGLGAHRLFDTISKVGKWGEQLNIGGSETSKSFFKKIGTADNVGAIPKIFHTSGNLVKSLDEHEFAKSNPGSTSESVSKKLTKVVYDGIEMVGDAAKIVMLPFPSFTPAKLTSDISDLTLDSRDLKEGIEGVQKSESDIEAAKTANTDKAEDVRRAALTRPTEEKRSNMLKIAKAICSVLAGAFGILGFIFKIAIVPSIVLLVLSTFALGFAVWRHYYDQTMTHKLAERLRERQLQVVSA